MHGSGTSRRAVLRAGLAGAGGVGVAALGGSALLVGCTVDRGAAPSRPTVDDEVRAQLRRSLSDLVDAYRSAIAAVPELVATAGSLLAEHLAHLSALGPGPTASPTASAVPAVAMAPTPSATAPPPTTLAAAQARLIALESAASTATSRLALRASAGLARLVASIAACEAAHAALLRARR